MPELDEEASTSQVEPSKVTRDKYLPTAENKIVLALEKKFSGVIDDDWPTCRFLLRFQGSCYRVRKRPDRSAGNCSSVGVSTKAVD